MFSAKVVLFMVAFDGYASIIVSTIVPRLSALNHGSNNLGSRQVNRPAALRRFARATSYIPSRVLSHHEAAKPYRLNYFIDDDEGNTHHRNEESDESGTVRGSYGYTDTRGLFRIVEYTADSNGFHANIKTNEPTLVGKKNPADVRLNYYPSAPDEQDEPQVYSDVKENEKSISGEIGRDPKEKVAIRRASYSAAANDDFESTLNSKSGNEEKDTWERK